MRLFQFFFLGCLLLAHGVVQGAGPGGETGTTPPNPHAAEVAVYDAILAGVEPGQTTVALGDMILPVDTVRLWRSRFAGGAQTQSATSTGVNLWTGGNVFYAFNANVTAAHKTDFLDAAGEWAAFANVHFIARTSQTNFVMVNEGGTTGQEGGNSAVGMIGGQQQLNITAGNWNRSTLVHEIGHTLGLIHEHQRSDRDTFVTINFSNVPGGTSDGNFILIPLSTNNGAYDFLSVMHYPRKAFAVNPAIDTITPKAGFTQFIDIMGNNPDRVLSRGDRDGMAAMYGAVTATTTVTNTNDSGPGALRTAIYKAFDLATDTPGATPTISFHIPNTDPRFSSGVFIIQPSDRLPSPGPGTIIDGTTQTTFTGDTNASGPEVMLNGALQVSPDTFGLGLRLSTSNVTVKGLIINGFSTRGIFVTGAAATGNVITGCYIGTDATGAASITNAFSGIEISGGAQNNTVGGTTVAARNVISGNTSEGVVISDVGSSGNVVIGNYIGTNPAGTAANPNAFSGVAIVNGATGNTIGGTAAGSMNLISGNADQGVIIGDAGTNGNVVSGNWIGLNAAGTGALANGFEGIQINGGAQNNTVGGSTAAARNVISGNQSQGVSLTDTGTSNNHVSGNYFGLNAAGTGAVANASAGVGIFAGATANTIGGTVAGSGNVLSGNAGQGVFIGGTGSSANVVAGNFIGTNPAGTAAIPNSASGVGISSGATGNIIGGTVSGSVNLISGNTQQGIVIFGAGVSNNVVSGNWVGLNAAGTGAIANVFAGIQISSGATGNTVGGTAPGSLNLVSGNTQQGIVIFGSGVNNNVVAGNWIGLNVAGTGTVPNVLSGVEINGGAQNNTIGGSTAAARNVISGNQPRGVAVDGTGTSNNRVSGNYIGVNAAGTSALANGGPGVEVFSGASSNTVGGTAPGAGNVISGNTTRGVTISGSGTNSNVLSGNFIGLNAAGTAAIPNAGPGVQIFSGPQGNTVGATAGGRNFIAGNSGAGLTISGFGTNGNTVVGNTIGVLPGGTVSANSGDGISLFADGNGGAQNNTIGGSTVGAANLISGNTGSGVSISNTGTINNRVSGNSIFANGGLGIDLGNNGVTNNDSGDGDTGPNNLQNFPVLSSAVLGVGTTVSGTLNSSASTTFRIEFFANATGDSSGNGEGQFFIGATSVTTNVSGNATIAASLPANIPVGQIISATATDPNGNTSEFAHNVTVTTTDTDGDGIPDAWLTAKFGHASGLSSDKSRATDDADGDGQTNLQEFRSGTDPKSSASILSILPPSSSGSDWLIGLPSVLGISYRIEYSTDLISTHWHPLADQIIGTGSTITITDPGAAAFPSRFYRAVVLP